MTSSAATWLAIVLVAGVVLAARLAGPLVMTRMSASYRVRRYLQALSISVIAALVASYYAQGGAREAVAVAVAISVMLTIKSAAWAMVAGMLAAASWSFVVSG